jgi:hypothetical protein
MRRAFYSQMKKNDDHVSPGGRVMDYASAAIQQMKLYCSAHPGSPSAVRRPHLFFRSELWIALLGPTMEQGIVGIGPTVAAALRAFDAQYLAGLRPPVKADTAGALRHLGTAQPHARPNTKSNPKPSRRSFPP